MDMTQISNRLKSYYHVENDYNREQTITAMLILLQYVTNRLHEAWAERDDVVVKRSLAWLVIQGLDIAGRCNMSLDDEITSILNTLKETYQTILSNEQGKN